MLPSSFTHIFHFIFFLSNQYTISSQFVWDFISRPQLFGFEVNEESVSLWLSKPNFNLPSKVIFREREIPIQTLINPKVKQFSGKVKRHKSGTIPKSGPSSTTTTIITSRTAFYIGGLNSNTNVRKVSKVFINFVKSKGNDNLLISVAHGCYYKIWIGDCQVYVQLKDLKLFASPIDADNNENVVADLENQVLHDGFDYSIWKLTDLRYIPHNSLFDVDSNITIANAPFQNFVRPFDYQHSNRGTIHSIFSTWLGYVGNRPLDPTQQHDDQKYWVVKDALLIKPHSQTTNWATCGDCGGRTVREKEEGNFSIPMSFAMIIAGTHQDNIVAPMKPILDHMELDQFISNAGKLSELNLKGMRLTSAQIKTLFNSLEKNQQFWDCVQVIDLSGKFENVNDN